MTITLPSIWTLFALTLSAFAFLVSVLNFRRKSSLSLRATYSWISSSVSSDDQHITSLIIENLKDRAVTIFAVYLRVGHNFYVEIDNFDDKPLVLKAFESWHKDYGTIEFYSVSLRRIELNDLFSSKRVKKRIVLSTSDGKYVARKFPKRWSPIHDFFRNHMTAVVRPVRLHYKDTALGGNVVYVVDIVLADGKSEIIPIHAGDHEVRIFRNFRLTKESLETTEALKRFLDEQASLGSLIYKSIEVLDVKEWRERERRDYREAPIKAKYVNWLLYRIGGRIATVLSDRRLQRENRHRLRATQPSTSIHGD